MSLIDIKGLKIEGRTGEQWQPILRGVDLSLQRGEVLGLIGESGAGKSTLGIAAMGMVRPGCRITGGSIRFDGEELVGMPARKRRGLMGKRIAYVAQSAAAAFNPAHRLMDQHCEAPLWHGLTSRAEAEADAVALYRAMQLPDPERIGLRYPHQVSGGQLQRAMTAMAMACRPDLIIFDEPTTALDVTTQIEVLAAIRAIVRNHGTAALYITHDLAVVAQMADRIKVLLQGEEVEEAPTRTMLEHPREPYTKSLWAVRAFRRPERALPDGPPLLQLKNVSARYGKVPVLHDVTFDLYPGRTLAVVGESGSGKSTAARVITGLLPPSNGEVIFNGAPLPAHHRARPKPIKQQIQMIYQMADTALNPGLSVREIIARPVQVFTGRRGAALDARVAELIEQIGLEPELADRRPGALSGGQKQRVGIARALAAEPRLIICDEITSALDQLVAESILRLLADLQDRLGLTYMFITHDLATVEAIADYVVVMERGKVVEATPRAELFTPPHPAYTAKLLASVPQMDADWLDRTLAAHERAGAAPPFDTI